MPSRCCVPTCKGNYDTGPKVAVYSFPKDEEMKRAWLSAIQRKDFIPTKSSRVCELHFKKEDFITESSVFDNQTAKTVTVPLLVKRLKTDVVPSEFTNYPKSLLKEQQISTIREPPENKRICRENEQLAKAVALSLEEEKEYNEKITIKSLDDVLNVLNSEKFWHTFKNENNEVCVYNLLCNPNPIIEFSLVVSSDLYVSAFYKDKKISHLTKYNFPYKVNNSNELSDILDVLKECKQIENESSCCELILQLLYNIKTDDNE